jgi:hypothetical protein
MHLCLYTAPLAEIGRTTTKQGKENCVSLAWTPTTPYDARLDSPSFTFPFAKRLSRHGDRRSRIAHLQTAL